MKLRTPLLLFVLTMLGVLLLLCSTLLDIRRGQQEVHRMEARRLELYQLADELRSTSDEMARMARSYAATGDKRFERFYHEILDIRDGKQPRPSNYDSSYWHRRVALQEAVSRTGEKISFLDLLQRHQVEAEERAMLSAILARDDKLVNIELRAIAAVNGLLPPAGRPAGTSNPALALGLLYSAGYQYERAMIIDPLNQFRQHVDSKIDSQLAGLAQHQDRLSIVAALLSSVMLIALGWLAVWLSRRVMWPLKRMGEQAERIARGDYSVRVEEKGFHELRQLACVFNDMATAVEREMHALRRTEERLALSERHYRTLFDGAADAILIRPLSKAYADANRTACQCLGYSREELLARYPTDITAPEAYLDDDQVLALVSDKGWAIFDSVSVTRSGEKIPVEVSVRLVDYDGEPAILSVQRDITERLQMQEALARAKEFAEQLIETANVMVVGLDEQGRVQVFNAAAEAITGYLRHDILGRDWFSMVVPRQRFPEVWLEFESGHTMPKVFENPIVTRAGEIRRIAWQNSVVNDPAGNMTTISFGVDVTEVREAENRMRQLFEGAPIPVLVTDDAQQRVVFVNDRFRAVLGYDLDAFGDEMDWQRVMCLDCDGHAEASGTDSDSGGRTSAPSETLVRCKSGEQRIFEIHRSQVGKIRMVMFVDLTERLQAEQQIAELGELSQKIIEKTTSGILVTDAEGEIVLANQTAERIMGAKPGTLIGFDLVNSPVSQQHGITLMASQVIDTGEPAHFEGKFTTSFGREIWPVIDFIRIRLRGENLLLIVVSDLSDFKKAEISLREAKQAAESANRSKSEFLANMSHEIRTPMNAVIGLAQLALSTDLDARQRDYLKKIYQSSRSLLGILNDILDYSKIESGRLEIESVAFSPADMLKNVSSLFLPTLQEKGIQFDCVLDDTLPLRLLGDPLRIGQVLSNLIGNAVKFTQQGRIAVRLGGRFDNTGQFRLEGCVHDTGIGMDAGQLQRLFLPFSQGDGSITRRYGGSGLGLAISRRLLEMMGGEISVESEPDVGTIFRFTLGCSLPGALAEQADSAVSDLAAGAAGDPILAGCHILLVEDNALNQQVAREFLEQAGAQIVLAGNGHEALQKLKHQDFDAVLMDIHMPVMNGLEATRRIRADGHWRDLPVLAMTAAALPQDREACMAAGMNDFIAKPVEQAGLLDAVHRWVRCKDGCAGRVSPVDPAAGRALLSRLAILLEAHELVPEALLLEIADRFGANTEPVLRLQRALAVFNFETAMQALDTLGAKLKISKENHDR